MQFQLSIILFYLLYLFLYLYFLYKRIFILLSSIMKTYFLIYAVGAEYIPTQIYFLCINTVKIPTIIKCNISVFFDAPKLICLQYRLVDAIDQHRRDAISRASCRFAIMYANSYQSANQSCFVAAQQMITLLAKSTSVKMGINLVYTHPQEIQ